MCARVLYRKYLFLVGTHTGKWVRQNPKTEPKNGYELEPKNDYNRDFLKTIFPLFFHGRHFFFINGYPIFLPYGEITKKRLTFNPPSRPNFRYAIPLNRTHFFLISESNHLSPAFPRMTASEKYSGRLILVQRKNILNAHLNHGFTNE